MGKHQGGQESPLPENRSCVFSFPILCCTLEVQRLPQHTSNDPLCCFSGLSPRDLSLLQTVPSRMCSEVPRRYLGCVTYGVAFEGVSPADPRGKVCHICVGAGTASDSTSARSPFKLASSTSPKQAPITGERRCMRIMWGVQPTRAPSFACCLTVFRNRELFTNSVAARARRLMRRDQQREQQVPLL